MENTYCFRAQKRFSVLFSFKMGGGCCVAISYSQEWVFLKRYDHIQMYILHEFKKLWFKQQYKNKRPITGINGLLYCCTIVLQPIQSKIFSVMADTSPLYISVKKRQRKTLHHWTILCTKCVWFWYYFGKLLFKPLNMSCSKLWLIKSLEFVWPQTAFSKEKNLISYLKFRLFSVFIQGPFFQGYWYSQEMAKIIQPT